MQEDKLSYGDRTNFDNYDIEFENVSFSYGENKVLEDLSFSLKEKRTYALVGHSGSGKSTIAKLLSGFYKVDKGAIKIGGHRLEEYSKELLYEAFHSYFKTVSCLRSQYMTMLHLLMKKPEEKRY